MDSCCASKPVVTCIKAVVRRPEIAILVFFNHLFLVSSFVCFSSRRDQIPCCLNCTSGIPLVTKCKSLPCVILILDHVIASHVLLSATPSRPKSGKHVQCALHLPSTVTGSGGGGTSPLTLFPL